MYFINDHDDKNNAYDFYGNVEDDNNVNVYVYVDGDYYNDNNRDNDDDNAFD